MRILIVGGGKSGSYLAGVLKESHQVVVIEKEFARVETLQRFLPDINVLHGDGCEPEVLQSAGITITDMVTALTGHDEDNLVACFLSKLQNVPLVLGRVNDPRNEWLFNKGWGVDISISSISLITSIVQEEVNLGEIITLLKLRVGNLAIEELTIAEGTKAIGKNLAEIDFPPNTRVMAVISGNQARVPAGGTVLEEGDRLLLLADTDEKSQLRDVLGLPGD
jgi:trk system potassium uptake protein TrkA